MKPYSTKREKFKFANNTAVSTDRKKVFKNSDRSKKKAKRQEGKQKIRNAINEEAYMDDYIIDIGLKVTYGL